MNRCACRKKPAGNVGIDRLTSRKTWCIILIITKELRRSFQISNKWGENMTNKSKKITAAILAASVFSVSAMSAFADEVVDNLRYQQAVIAEQQAQAISQRDALREGISILETQKNAILSQIDEYDAKLVTTIATIETVSKQIAQKEKELEKTAADLKSAKEDEKTQYEGMRKRIQYMYEEGGNLGLVSTMMETGSISDVINRAVYTQKMYEYDRECLASYTEAKEKVTALQKQQLAQKSELQGMKREQEGVKKNLETLKDQARKDSEDYEAQIAYCEDVAAQYQALIDEQYAQICQLQAMEAEAVAAEQARIAAAAEAQRQAEIQAAVAAQQAAAQQAAAQEAAAQQAGAVYTDDGSGYYDTGAYDTGVYDDTGFTDAGYDAAGTYTDDGSYGVDYSGYDVYTDDYSYDTYTDDYSYLTTDDTTSYSASGSGIGSDIANFALQFVGNPYVWGGTSLTNGCDCSGFVQQVFANYGVDLSRTTYTQANEGTAVSYSEMQPGDVINYGSHTAIYIGDNQIVHAADESLGIIVSDNPAYQPITTIRRFT